MTKRLIARFSLALFGTTLLLGAYAPGALGSAVWSLHSLSDTNAAPGSVVTYTVIAMNTGDAPAPATVGGDANNCVPGAAAPSDPAKCYTIRAEFPPELTPLAGGVVAGQRCEVQATSITCFFPGDTIREQILAHGAHTWERVTFTAQLSPSASGTVTAGFEVAGGEAANVGRTVEPTVVSALSPRFGIDAFDVWNTADAAGTPSTQAGAHPFEFTTALRFNTFTHPASLVGSLYPVESTRDIIVDLPAGAVGDPTVLERCSADQLANGEGIIPRPLCPSTSQVGIALTPLYNTNSGEIFGPTPVYNMVPPPNAPARLGFNVSGTIVTLDATLRTDGDYGLRATVRNVPELGVQGTLLTVWGVPSSPAHDLDRACPGERYPRTSGAWCRSGKPLEPFLRNPTSCSPPGVGLLTTVSIDSWEHPGVFVGASTRSHLPPGFPAAPSDWGPQQGTEGCEQLPFDPRLSGGPPAGARAGAPTAMSFDLSLTQTSDPDVLGTADVKKVVATLPEGVRVSPSSADGLQGCSTAQIALRSAADPACPVGSRLGSVTIDTPLLEDPLSGGIYLATPFENPFNSLIAVYIAVRGQGVAVKLPGKVELDPNTGQITTTFDNNPQAPIGNVHLAFEGGPRAPLSLPNRCGTYTMHSEITSWSGRTVPHDSSFTIGQGCEPQGFSPTLNAGVDTPIAGAHSPLALQIRREDTDQEIRTVDTALPPGLTAVLKGVSVGSQVGTVIAGAGAGSNPFYIHTGKVFLAGPYKGAPLSLLFSVPALAGPFDLGVVEVRAAAHVNPVTAQVTAKADPLPTILQGIPLDVRDIRVHMDRPNFTLNPTSCDPMSVDAALTSTQGATANASDRFQLAECSRLGFKPKLTLRLRGKTTRGAHPALTAILKPRRGDANLSKVSVALPKSEFLDQAHIRTICTRAQFAASECPRGAIYGHATVTTPLFDQTLSGPVYLRSSSNLLPDLVPDLRGPDNLPIRIESAGRVDEVNGGIRNTFDFVPDAPFTKLVMRLKGGNKGLLVNSRNICKQAFRATVQMDAHNGKVRDFRPVLRADCGKKKGKKGKR